MADTVTSQTLYDGTRNAIMKFTNISDGTGESAVLKVDASTLVGSPTEVSIYKIEYSTQGMLVNLLWDATTDVLAFSLPTDMTDTLEFAQMGGIWNNSGAGKTGDINITTVNHSLNDTYSIVLHLVKKFT